MFTEPVRRFSLGEILARTGTVYLVIRGLAINLAGNPSMPVDDFHMPIQCEGNGFVDPGRVGGKDGLGFFGSAGAPG